MKVTDLKSKLEKLTPEGFAAFSSVADLPDEERIKVLRTLAYFNLGKDIPVSETQMREELLDDLHNRLVQCAINFINEKNMSNIHSVSFYADSLSDSAKCGKWMPCTDSVLSVYGEDNSGLKEIGFSA